MRNYIAGLFSLLVLAAATGLGGQTLGWVWAERAGTAKDDYGQAIATDSHGNIYVTGDFQGTADFGPFTLSSSNIYNMDVFVAKLDPDGNWLWAASAGGNGQDRGFAIAVDSLGYVYVGGYFSATMVDSVACFGDIQLTSAGGNDIFAAKLSPGGEWLWAARAGGSSTDACMGIAIDDEGNCYLTGYFLFTADFGSTTLTSAGVESRWDIFAAKLDSGGNWLWAARAGGTENDVGNGIALDSSGNPCLTGHFQLTADFGVHTLTSSGNNDVCVAKLDPNGDWLWAARGGGTEHEYGYGIAMDGEASIFVTGGFRGTAAHFGSTTLNANSSSYNDIFVASLDSTGAWQWAKRAGRGGSVSDTGYCIATNEAGLVYVAGLLRGVDADFGPFLLSSQGNDDVFAACLSSGGDWQWAISAGGPYSDYAYGMAADYSGNVCLAGKFGGTASFGSSQLTSLPTNSGSVSMDIFIAKIGELPPIPEPPANLEVALFGEDILLSWNPVGQDIYGNPLTPDLYYIYVSDNPEGEFTYLDHSATPLFLDIGAAVDYGTSFYQVTAVKFLPPED